MRGDHRKFQKGSGAYMCSDCGKLTRETGRGESQCGLCKTCLARAELQNLVNDGGWPELQELQDKNPEADLLELAKQLDPSYIP